MSDKAYTVTGDLGANVMYAGVSAGVPFEQACGGSAECCTCHVYIPMEEIK